MIEWLDDFYGDPDLRSTMLRNFLPVFSSYVAEATGGPVAAGFVQALAESYVDRHLGSSRAQLQEVVKAADDPLTALAQRFDEWEEKRPGKVAANELVRSANAGAVEKMREAGVTKMVWRASGGKTCPFCTELDGTIISVDGTFFEAGDELNPEGATAPIHFESSLGHPPVHQGCVCSVEAVTETEQAPYSSIDQMPQDVRDAYERGGFDSIEGDTQLRALTDAQGFTGKPQVLSDAEIDRLVANGDMEFFRGVSKESYADRWMNGDSTRHGTGYYGNGTYTAVGRGAQPSAMQLQQGYTQFDAREVAEKFAGSDGTVLRGTLRSDARVLNVDSVLDAGGQRFVTQDLESVFQKLTDPEWEMDSITHIAAGRGYDAVLIKGVNRIGGEVRGDQLIILNRGAVRMSTGQ